MKKGIMRHPEGIAFEGMGHLEMVKNHGMEGIVVMQHWM